MRGFIAKIDSMIDIIEILAVFVLCFLDRVSIYFGIKAVKMKHQLVDLMVLCHDA